MGKVAKRVIQNFFQSSILNFGTANVLQLKTGTEQIKLEQEDAGKYGVICICQVELQIEMFSNSSLEIENDKWSILIFKISLGKNHSVHLAIQEYFA